MNVRVWFIICAMLLSCLGADAEPTKPILFDVMHQSADDGIYWALDEDVCDTAQQKPTPTQQSPLNEMPVETVWTGALSALGLDLVWQGFKVETLGKGARLTFGDTSNEQDLSRYAVYVIVEPNVQFDEAEIAAIRSFVQAGGGLLLVADRAQSIEWDTPRILNAISADFGIRFNNKSAERFGSFSDTGGTFDPQSFLFLREASGLTLSDSTSIAIADRAKGHAWITGVKVGSRTGVTLATAEASKGRVVAVGDSAIVGDATRCKPGLEGHYLDSASGNRAVVLKALKWLAKVTTTSADIKINFLAPANESTVTGSSVPVTVNVSGSDVNSVILFIDGKNTEASVKRQPPRYEWQWDLTTIQNGKHKLRIKVYSVTNKEIGSDEIIVNVANSNVLPARHDYFLIGIAVLVVIAAGLLYRKVASGLHVRVVSVKDSSPETIAFSLFCRYLPVLAEVQWRSEPPVQFVATLDGEVIPSEHTRTVTRSWRDSIVSIVFPKALAEGQQTKITVDIVAYTRYVAGKKSEASISRVIGRELTPVVSGRDVARESKTGETVVVGEVASAVEPTMFGDELSIERATIEIVHAIMTGERADRAQLCEMLRSQGVQASIASPHKVPESASTMFTKYWFEPDEHAGTWLWVALEGNRHFLTVPFDLRPLKRSSLLSHLSSLYEGVDEANAAIATGSIRFGSLARLTRGDGNSYRLIRRGTVTVLGLERLRKSVPSFERKRERDLGADDGRLVGLENRVAHLERALQEERSRDRRQPGPVPGDLYPDALRGVEGRLGRLEQRVDTFSREISDEMEVLGRRLSAMEALQDQLGRSLTEISRDAIARSDADAISSLVDERKAVPPAATIVPEVVLPVFRPAPAPSISVDNEREIVALPPGWDGNLSRTAAGLNFGEASSYAQALMASYNELCAIAPHGIEVMIVHLLPASHGTDTIYEVHTENIGSNSPVFRCADNPNAHTPAQQFFVAFRISGDRMGIVCIPGNYTVVSFDLTPLVGEIPGTLFKIERVTRPAVLERRDDGRYRVVAKMMAVVAAS